MTANKLELADQVRTGDLLIASWPIHEPAPQGWTHTVVDGRAAIWRRADGTEALDVK